jgi:transcriptional regulator of acetoin/glycerol metabolism
MMRTDSGWESLIDERPPSARTRTVAEVHAADLEKHLLEDDVYEASAELLRAARPVLLSLEDALEDTTTWLALADARGIVTLEWASSARLKRQLMSADVETGVELGEDRVGRNGIGHALATRSASHVAGTEHSNEDWFNLSCAASPIIHPVTRQLMGVVNITCLAEEENPHLRVTLRALLTGISQSLLSRSQSRHQRLLDAHLRVKRAAIGAVLTLDAHTMIVDDEVGAIALDREVLWDLVNDVGALASELTLPSGQRVQLVPVSRGRVTDGCSLIFGRGGARGGVMLTASADAPGPHRARRDRLSPLEQAEYDVIASVMRELGGNKSEVAARLRISRGTLYDRLRRYGLLNG